MIEDRYKHPAVGSYDCLYVCSLPCEMGRVRNLLSFQIQAGDNPDWFWAQRMMPRIVTEGPIEAIIECETSGECPSPEEWPRWECELRVGHSVFRTRLPSPDRETLEVMLQNIGGGLRLKGEPSPALLERLKLYFLWYWERRPVIRRRNPIGIKEL